ncbi:MAG TPA: FAD-dependent oxidoreductase, partial [Deltaproteobacteria bacterium]|nr:FAD-dependent oxidoreductase [Deltaproteobacteria bacterium]
MARECSIVVVGAGVVGLAAAAALARAGRFVVVLERNGGIAREITSRNSQVIHAGLYYPKGSHKAVLCVAGRELLYERCAAQAIPHRRTGKLVVATNEREVSFLERLAAQGVGNGAPGLELVDGAAVRRLEPAVRAVAALYSPASGIVDAHAFALSFAAEAEAHGATIALEAELVGVEPAGGGYKLGVRRRGGELETLRCDGVVNAAGLGAERVAQLAGIDTLARGWRIHPCKGDYFALAPGAPLRFERLVYPVPAGAGLGIHATLDLGGRIRFGPDAEYVDKEDYRVDARKAERFAEAVRRYVPSLEAAWLSPDQAGVRPKLQGPGEGFRD